MSRYTAHVDTFARDHLPPPEAQPEFIFDLPELQFPERLNCATELLDRHVKEGRGDRRCVSAPGGPTWTYAELQRQADRIAHVLVAECGLVPGNRVLLRAANKPMLVACWFAVMKAGGIAVATMPMLRAKELGQIIEKGQVTIALCDASLRERARRGSGRRHRALARIVCFGDTSAPDGLEARMARHDAPFANVDTAADDTCLFAFTSGTTGQPKATMHFHRDVMASCVCFPPHVLRAAARRRLHRQPAARVHLRARRPDGVPDAHRRLDGAAREGRPADLLEAIAAHRATVCVTAPTSYRAMAAGAREKKLGARDGGSLRKCVAAGEALPGGDARALEGRDRHRDHRRHRRDRDVPHLHLRRRGERAARRHRHRRARLPRARRRRRRQRRSRRHDRAPRGAGPDRLPLPERPAPGRLREGRLELHRRRLPAGRRRLLLLPVAHRRHDHLGRLQHRRDRGRRRAAAPRGRRRVRGHRPPGRRARPDRQGVRRAARAVTRATRRW